MKTFTPAEANAIRHHNQFVHLRNPDDNESALCGALDGAAVLQFEEATCERCFRVWNSRFGVSRRTG